MSSTLIQEAPPVPNKRRFQLARDVLKKSILAQNPKAEQLDFNDLVANIDTTKHEITLRVAESPVNPYIVTTAPVIRYNKIRIAEFLKETLNFVSEYKYDQYDTVLAALPDGFETTTEEKEIDGRKAKIVKVSVKAQATSIPFKDSITTAAIFIDSTVKAELVFKEDKIEIGDFITEPRIETTNESLLESEGKPTLV